VTVGGHDRATSSHRRDRLWLLGPEPRAPLPRGPPHPRGPDRRAVRAGARRRARWVGTAGRQPARRQAAATTVPHIKCVADAAAVIADPDVDAVAIATPIFTHHALAKAALEAGKHVVVEKPLAPSVAEAEELAQLAARAGRVLMVDHTFVYTSAVRKIRDLIARGELGRVLYLDSVRINLALFPRDYSVLRGLATPA